MFFGNLKKKLGWFNYNKPYYFGNPTTFTDCDGVKEMGKGPFFAHGGSGIILSRGAVLKMLPIIDQCIQKYKDCFAGDIRVALCLRDVNIFFTNIGGFHHFEPHENLDLHEDCHWPITYHHLKPEAVQK